ncbi:MAG: ATP-dependent helicase [Chloroflexi bacterium]|nr:ATP-dependent helicase [Chloroflexota bacterium]
MSIDLTSLNETQLQAVQWQDGPLLVLAGPGSGKTRILTYRIARIIEDSDSQHFRVLGLTFTTKAAAEMRERIAVLVPAASDRILLSTFHSFAADILRQHGHLIGLRPDFAILSQDAERAAVLDEALSLAGLDSNTNMSGEQLLPAVTRLLDHAADQSTAMNLLLANNTNEPEMIVAAYFAYRQRMIARNNMDFGCLIAEALRLLQERPMVARQIRRVYKYISVDEFQDTNKSQYDLLSLLVDTDTKNLFVVADDDQIIYQWNGASPERLNSLRNDFGMSVLQLPQNYRCPAAVIDLANRLILHNVSRSDGKQALQAYKQPTEANPIRHCEFNTFDDEADWIAGDIAARPLSERSLCVILARTRRTLQTIVDQLTSRGIQAHLAVRKDDWVSAPLRLLHSLLRLANTRQDHIQLRRTCRSFYDIEGINLKIDDIVAAAVTYDGDYLRSFATLALARTELESTTRRFLDSSLSKLMDRLDHKGFIADCFAWLDQVVNAETTNGFSEYDSEKQVWNELVCDINLQYGAENVTLHLLLQEMDLRSKAPKPPTDAVLCYTIHASKGLEFHHVYLAGLVEDQLPSWDAVKKGDNSPQMQEERRNCFVAITRTQETLTLTYSKIVQGWPKKPSRFLSEMGILV